MEEKVMFHLIKCTCTQFQAFTSLTELMVNDRPSLVIRYRVTHATLCCSP